MEQTWTIRNRVSSDDQESLERLVTLMIVNNEFLNNVQPMLSDLSILPGTGYLPMMVKWIIDYGEKNGRAPRSNMRTLFEDYRKQADKDEPNIDFINSFLTKINGRYARGEFNDVDLTFELDRAESFLQSRALIEKNRAVIDATRSGNVHEAVQLDKDFQLPFLSGQPKTQSQMLQEIAINDNEFLSQNLQRPEYVIDPWLTDGSLTMIYAPTGVGKTWLCLILGIGATRKDYKEVNIGPWSINNSCGTLYVDGEMQQFFLSDRMTKITKHDPPNPKAPFTLVSASMLGAQFREPLNIGEPQWREAIYDFIKNDERYQLLILDNLASLTPGLDENSKQEWDPINQWILTFRQLGVSVIMVHHAGKSGKQRGTSGREDPLDTIIQLTKPDPKYVPPEYREKPDLTIFEIRFQKARDADPEKVHNFMLGIAKSSRKRGIDWFSIEYHNPDTG